MSDKILLLTLALCLGYGGFKFISGKIHHPEPTVASESQTKPPAVAPPSAEAPAAAPAPVEASAEVHAPVEAPAEAPVKKPPVVKKILPPKISLQDLKQRFRVDGIATGSHGKIVMINKRPLHEGETLDDLRIEKILPNAVVVFYKGHSYQLGRQLLPNSNF